MVSAALDRPVRLESGFILGVRVATPGVRAYLGVPYAAPPVGALRWRAPQPPLSWDGVQVAGAIGPSAIQKRRDPTGPSFDGPFEFSEDCLSLNIWTAAESDRERRPVFVWIHGGGFVDGAGSLPSNSGEGLSAKGPVVVAINYRLNVFGFLAHPELSAESEQGTSGNYGLLDMVAAVQWVRRNIAGFGGNPDHIVIGGLSAGSMAVSALTASPLLRGLLRGAVAQSILFDNPFFGRIRNVPEMEAQGLELAAAAGAPTLAALRRLPAEAVVEASRQSGLDKFNWTGDPLPVIDGWILPADALAAEAAGLQDPMPLLTGSTADEGFPLVSPLSAGDFIEKSRQEMGRLADRFFEHYPARTEEEAIASQFASIRDKIAWQHARWAELRAAKGLPVYLYHFTHPLPTPPDARPIPAGRQLPKLQGAFHGGDKFFSLNSLAALKWRWRPRDREMAETMSTYWANFIASGNPNGPGLPYWPRYGEGTASVLELGAQIRAVPSVLSAEKTAFWAVCHLHPKV